MIAEIGGCTICAERVSPRGDVGFTLLDVVVALALASLALMALFQAGSAGLLTVDSATRIEATLPSSMSRTSEFSPASAAILIITVTAVNASPFVLTATIALSPSVEEIRYDAALLDHIHERTQPRQQKAQS